MVRIPKPSSAECTIKAPPPSYLQTLLGSLSTEAELAKACDFFDNTQTEIELRSNLSYWEGIFAGEDDDNEERANQNINDGTEISEGFEESSEDDEEDVDDDGDDLEERATLEMGLYRKTRHTSAYFIHEQDVDMLVLWELDRAVDYWIFLTSHDALESLIEGNVKVVKVTGGTCAETFRAFVDAYKKRKGFATWTLARMVGLRYKVYSHVKRSHHKRAQAPSELPVAKRQKLSDNTNENRTTRSENKDKDEMIQPEAVLTQNSDPGQDGVLASGSSTHLAGKTPSNVSQDTSQGPKSPVTELFSSFPAALKATQNYDRTRTIYDLAETTWQEATNLTAATSAAFPGLAKEALYTMHTLISNTLKYSEGGWTLENAQATLRRFADQGKLLEERLNDYINPLVAEQNAKVEYDAARKEFTEWEGKKKVVEQALSAIQALKDL